MYSRYQRNSYDPSDEDDIPGESLDVCELYRYNLPPKYDGSRFSRHHTAYKRVEEAKKTSDHSQKTFSTSAEQEPAIPSKCTLKASAAAPALPDFTPHVYEEILIICLILLIAEKGDNTFDIILLLILLAAK